MPTHSDRRATPWWAKSGPPRKGLRQETRWLRRGTCRGNQPLLRAAPFQRVSCRNQDDPERLESALKHPPLRRGGWTYGAP